MYMVVVNRTSEEQTISERAAVQRTEVSCPDPENGDLVDLQTLVERVVKVSDFIPLGVRTIDGKMYNLSLLMSLFESREDSC